MLPADLEAIAKRIGRDLALDLARSIGGRRIYVPAAPGGATWGVLCNAVGFAAAGELVKHFGRDTLYIPLARKPLVKRLAGEGMSTRAIAAELGLAHNSVSRYRATA